LPDILGALRMQAPRIGIDVMRIDAQLGDAMQAGRIDLALGYIPALAQGFYHQTLFAQDFICLVGADHPRLHKRLTRVAYAEETHVDIVLGTGRLLIEAGLAKAGLHRHIGLRLPGFLGLSRILAASDLVATLPRHIGETLAAMGGLRSFPCPFPVEGFTVEQHWHARVNHDPANRWLRGVCAGLFIGSALPRVFLPAEAGPA
ncbi:MAG: LysR substrate-binding domain-containing protein, partial [Beijerinckiaceae bacterium]